MRSYTLQQLSIFHEIISEGSMNKAAQNLGMNQSAVSRAVATLESHLGFKLFYRYKNQLNLTREGIKFLTELDKLKESLSVFDESVDLIKQGLKELRVGVPSGLSLKFAPKMIRHYTSELSDVGVRLDIRSSQALCDDVRRGNLDIALVAMLGEIGADSIANPIISAPLVCVLPTTHPLCGETSLSIEQIVGQDIIFPGKLDIAGMWIDKIDPSLFKQAKVISNIGSIIGLVEQGMGIAVLNVITAMDFANNDAVRIVPLRPLMQLEIYLLSRLDWMENHDLVLLTQSIKNVVASYQQQLPQSLSHALRFNETPLSYDK